MNSRDFLIVYVILKLFKIQLQKLFKNIVCRLSLILDAQPAVKLSHIHSANRHFTETMTQISTKGQLISEWIYEVIVSPKIWTKNCQDFYPHYTGQKSWQFFVCILGETMTSYIHSEIYWPLLMYALGVTWLFFGVLDVQIVWNNKLDFRIFLVTFFRNSWSLFSNLLKIKIIYLIKKREYIIHFNFCYAAWLRNKTSIHIKFSK